MKTIEDLKEGIIGETTASRKYEAFAKKAEEENLGAIATLFYATSKAEAIHAANHLKVLEGLGIKMPPVNPLFEIKGTRDNIQVAIEGEHYEVATMYPTFIDDAKNENSPKALKSFTWAYETEKKHEIFFKNALKALDDKQLETLPISYAVCPICGNTYDNAEVDERCAFCKIPKEKFIIF